MMAWAWAPFKAPCPLAPLRNGSIVVDYVVQLELPFSPQLESEYEKVKVALKEELQNVSQNETGCQKDQGEQKLGALGWREGSGSQPPSQPAPAQTGSFWGQVPALWYLWQVGRRDTGPQPTGSRMGLRRGSPEPGCCGRDSSAQGFQGG